MHLKFHLAIATLALTPFNAAQATISLPTIVPVPIPAGILITDGGGATLDGYVSHDIIVNTTNDWIATALLIQLDSGSIYQEKEGVGNNGVTLGQPNPALFGLFPSSEFDTSIFGPNAAVGITGGAGDLGGSAYQFDSTAIAMTWNSAGSDKSNFGATDVSRITLSGDAQGTWSLAVSEAFDPKFARFLNNPIINGQMVLAPLTGDLNFDGFVGIEELNIVLAAWNQTVTPYSQPDPSGDGFVGISDLGGVILGNWNAGTPPRPTVPVFMGLPGDADGDGFVGIADKVTGTWNLFVTPGDLDQRDMSGDGYVGLDDLNIWLSNWNNGTPPLVDATVPEPASIAGMCLGLTLVTSRNRNRR